VTPEDRRYLDEGAYWSDYVRVHYDVGDTSILDVRSKSNHPSFYNLGLLERDDKDKARLYGMWPDHLSRVIFGFLENLKPGRALDVGCGGGQFGLEAAWQGWDVVAIDIAPGALEVARDYAARVGKKIDYIYAEPSNPPFQESAFDLLMAKDALHHLPHLDRVFGNFDKILRDKAHFLFFEHVGNSPIAQKIKNWINRYLHPKIQKRYPLVEVPDVLKRGAPCEDLGREDIIRLTEKHFQIRKAVFEIMLYHDLEFSVYYAFGKRLWFSSLAAWLIRWLIEKPLLLFQKPEFAVLLGNKR
jgi:SAM-dependent methyltransferase